MKQRIALVVDDEAHITQVVSLKLRNAGFEIFNAADGEEAYEIACAQLPNVIVTDLQMPYMSGLELCQKLKANPATAHIPAILVTARGHALSSEDMATTNIREVMSKPFSPREVLEKVLRLVDGAGGEAEAA